MILMIFLHEAGRKTSYFIEHSFMVLVLPGIKQINKVLVSFTCKLISF